MTEIGEGVASNVIDLEHDPESCPFCQATPPAVRDNIFTATHDEDSAAARDAEQWVKFPPEPNTLAGQLERPSTRGVRRAGDHYVPGDDLPVAVVPHHLIPGAALQSSTLVTSGMYLRSAGSAAGNIGYDVNRAANGVWAPSNHAYRPWGADGAAFNAREGLPAQAYIYAAIDVHHAQFHDAHEVYADVVRDALDRLQESLVHAAANGCPVAQNAPERALTVLVQRLDALSSRLRRLVCFPSTGWKAEVFLSRASQQYMSDRGLGGD